MYIGDFAALSGAIYKRINSFFQREISTNGIISNETVKNSSILHPIAGRRSRRQMNISHLLLCVRPKASLLACNPPEPRYEPHRPVVRLPPRLGLWMMASQLLSPLLTFLKNYGFIAKVTEFIRRPTTLPQVQPPPTFQATLRNGGGDLNGVAQFLRGTLKHRGSGNIEAVETP